MIRCVCDVVFHLRMCIIIAEWLEDVEVDR